ncbi:MAG: invasion protein CiaB [Sulfurovaceae bacterium]|nr:invasion protein CiaB [Sulfurovaceae bacterium]
MNRFIQDTQIIYDELTARQDKLNGFFRLTHEPHDEADKAVEDFLNFIGCERNEDSTMAALTRIVNLREDALEQVLQKMGYHSDDIIAKKELVYWWTSRLHTARHESLLKWVEENGLLTPFYRTLLNGVHEIGIAMSVWQSEWTAHIIHTINRELLKQFHGNDKAVLAYLHEYSLLDKDTFGVVNDRCYSVLDKSIDEKHCSVAYSEAFKDEVNSVSAALSNLIQQLEVIEDDVWDQKEAWIKYFQAINDALLENNVSHLLSKWQKVDRTWMSIKTPIQVGHPLEYYEDHYRKAVALEWDVRIINPKLQHGSKTRENIIGFTGELAQTIGNDAIRTAAKNISQLSLTQLYIGQPMLYYAAEFNGLFSAQVVPNDKVVSDELGHKIFAYADFVLASKLSKPIMKLNVEIMGEEFVKNSRSFAEHCPELWHEVYDISTIGHEFGHTLWLDEKTEGAMNQNGQFKNIEEFKATAGGLMAFFHNEKEELNSHIIDDLVNRSVGLMAWREVGEVLPYYCEGLIHLHILFESKIIDYKDRIYINYEKYEDMKNLYKEAYTKLAIHYIAKKDASEYLYKYAVKEAGVYLPVEPRVRAFVEHYYARYQEIGQQTIKL